MSTASAPTPDYRWLRWFTVLWLLVYLPVYADTYGAWHFLFLCNTGIVLTAVGLLVRSQLLLSSQLLAAPAISLVWLSDALWRLLSGQFLHGGTAYMWDPAIPALARVLSLYHLAWPLLLAYCASRHGYDRRGLPLQCLVAALSMLIGLTLAPASENINYLFHGPTGTVGALAPEVRGLLFLATLCLLVYWPTHALVSRLFRPTARPPRGADTVSGSASPTVGN